MARTRFFKVKVTTVRSNVKSRSNYDKVQLHFPTNVPTKYKLPAPYGFRVMVWTRFFNIKITTARSKVKSRLNYDIAHLHPQPKSLPSINTLPLIVTEISPGQDICRRPPARLTARPLDRPPSRTPWVKTIPQSLLRLWGKTHILTSV